MLKFKSLLNARIPLAIAGGLAIFTIAGRGAAETLGLAACRASRNGKRTSKFGATRLV